MSISQDRLEEVKRALRAHRLLEHDMQISTDTSACEDGDLLVLERQRHELRVWTNGKDALAVTLQTAPEVSFIMLVARPDGVCWYLFPDPSRNEHWSPEMLQLWHQLPKPKDADTGYTQEEGRTALDLLVKCFAALPAK